MTRWCYLSQTHTIHCSLAVNSCDSFKDWLSSEEQQWLSQSYDMLHAVCSFVQPASGGRHLEESQHSAEHLLAPIALLCCNNPEPVQKHCNNQ